MPFKKILCLDFDGVIHSYTSPWVSANVIPDPPVPGAMQFIKEAIEIFEVAIFSSRTHQYGGQVAMEEYIWKHLCEAFGTEEGNRIRDQLKFPQEKPPAFLTIDDRAICFTGTFMNPSDLALFKPWNKTT